MLAFPLSMYILVFLKKYNDNLDQFAVLLNIHIKEIISVNS
jgi:hypothetical protein